MPQQEPLPEDFWHPRDCFERPPPVVHRAVDLLDAAVSAIIAGDREKAADLIKQADIPEIYHDFVQPIWGSTDLRIHRYRHVPDAPERDRKVKARMPGAPVKRIIYERDGWRCRLCDVQVISPDALNFLRKMFPNDVRQGSRDIDTHTAFLALKAVVDHILPHSRGGNNDPHNLVTTCGPCNYGRSDWTLEEVGLKDPRLRSPIVDEWDGLTRLLQKPG